jgi:hypothetical protein
MNTILLTAGVVALMAAVIGGDIDALNIRIPLLRGRVVRTALGMLGLAFLLAAVLLPGGTGDDGNLDATRRQQEAQARHEQEVQARHEREVEAQRKQDAQARHEREVEARYQRGVSATCNAVRRATGDLPLIPGPGQNIDRDAQLAAIRAGFDAAAGRLRLLFAKSAPKPLRHDAKIAQGRAESYIREARRLFNTLRATLPAYPTLEEFRAAGTPTTRSIEVVQRLEAAMTELAGRDCTLSSL